MSELVEFYKQLSALGFGGLLFAILVASWRGKFVWDREHEQLRATMQARIDDLTEQLDRARKRIDAWELVALRASGMAETLIEQVARGKE